MAGAALDVAVDLQVGLPWFGKWQTVRPDDQDRRAVFLAEDLGHGFMTLSEQATLMYLCSTAYAHALEHGVRPLDPGLGIAWPWTAAEVAVADYCSVEDG